MSKQDESGRDRVVVIPTYNEAENLRWILARLHAAVPDVDVLVVDDASPDGTGAIADDVATEDDRVHVLHRDAKAGLGSAYVAGFRWALPRGYAEIVEMDADGSHAPEDLPRLFAAAERADVVLGSRWIPGGEVRNWPWPRLLLSRLANLYVRILLRLPICDATGGFRVYRADVLRSLPLDQIASEGYCFQIDVALRALRAGYHVVEVPIVFTERVRGTSKMSRSIVIEALWRVTVWGFTDHRERRPRRVLTETAGSPAEPGA